MNQNYHNIQNYQIQYDISKPIELIKQSIMNKNSIKWGNALIRLIQTGTDYPAIYIQEVLEIAKEYGLDEDLDKIPIEVWNEARKNLELL